MASTIRFSPTNDLLRLQREFDQFFNAFLPGRDSGSRESENAVWSPRADFAETEEDYLVRFDLPGVSREDIDISYHEGTLTVSGERKAENTEEKQNYVHLERVHGRFFRSFTLPKAVDPNQIDAAYVDGVLTIRLHKAEESKPRRITVS